MANSTQVIIAAVVSFVVGWFSHVMSTRRDRKAREHNAQTARDQRKYAFLKFMAQWRSEVDRSFPGSQLAAEYRSKVHLFRAESACIDNDFASGKWPEFGHLCVALCDLDESKIYRDRPKDGREVIAEAIEAVVRFVEAN